MHLSRSSKWLVFGGALFELVLSAVMASGSGPALVERGHVSPAASSPYTIFDAHGFPQPARRAFEPGSDGTPLPARSADAAKHWPPEFKRFLERSFSILKRGGLEPKVAELQEALDVHFESGRNIDPSSGILERYSLRGIQFGPKEPLQWGHELAILGLSKSQGRFWQLKILVDADVYCVNPYEMAIYLGEPFIESDSRLHIASPDVWPPTYTWGMFKRGTQGEHISRSIWITTMKQTPGQPRQEPGCISSFVLFGTFTGE